MKQFLLLFFISLSVFSQTDEHKKFDNKYAEFDYYAQPNKNNNLSIFIRKNIDTKLLDAIDFNYKDDNKKRVFLTFKLDENNKVKQLQVNSPYSELNTSIKEAFKNYGIEKLNIPEKDQLNIYVLQLFSTEDGNVIVNCSTNIIYDRFPIFEGCESITTYGKMRKCINKQLESHIVKHISPEIIKEEKILGNLRLEPRFSVDEKGVIKNIKSKAISKELTEELNRIVALFPNAKFPPTRNGNPTTLFYKGKVLLKIDAKSEKYEKEVEKSNDSILNPNNALTLHFKKYLSKKELEKVVFSAKQTHINISFSLNKKNKLVNLKTNSKDPSFNNKIVKIFKKFPIEKLNIKSSNVLELYSTSVITKEHNKNIIECREKPFALRYPIFNKKCEKSKNPVELKKCLSENISDIITREIDNNLGDKTKLTGDVKIYSQFQVDTLGKIINVKVMSPNPFFTKEVKKLLESMPKLYKPGYINGKPVIMPFSIPMRYGVNKKKPKDPFEDLNKINKRKYN